RPRAGRLGADGGDAQSGESGARAADGRGLGRRRRGLRAGRRMTAFDLLFAPFADYGFMRRALAGCLALSVGACPLGVLLVLRRMSLVGDAMSHAILPGAA